MVEFTGMKLCQQAARKIRPLVLIATAFVTLKTCYAQEFDRQLEKAIKTEINLNRIAKSQSPLDLSSIYKLTADSLNMLAYRFYLKNTQITTKGIEEDWDAIWAAMEEKMNYDHHFVIAVDMYRHSDYKKILREAMWDKECDYYRLQTSEISLSAIKYGEKIFVTIITW
jgi:hypothetical protein